MRLYLGFIIAGLFTGSIYGLAAMGVVLKYKTTGVFNFAYGAISMICAYAYWQFHDSWGITAWAAIPLLLVVELVIGVLFEQLFRPLAGLSAEIPIVVSLALLALLQAVAILVWKGQAKGLQPVIPRSSFHLANIVYVGYDQRRILVIALLAGAFRWWLRRHKRFGTAT